MSTIHNANATKGTKNLKVLQMEAGMEKRITEIMEAMEHLLIEKNKRYGNSALEPQNIFYKGSAEEAIFIRLDDKLSRVKANINVVPRVNDVCDIIGYCTLLLISMGVTKEDIEKLED